MHTLIDGQTPYAYSVKACMKAHELLEYVDFDRALRQLSPETEKQFHSIAQLLEETEKTNAERRSYEAHLYIGEIHVGHGNLAEYDYGHLDINRIDRAITRASTALAKALLEIAPQGHRFHSGVEAIYQNLLKYSRPEAPVAVPTITPGIELTA